ncbi:MAG TPA: 4-hydroxy-3-methylbut-2-en-1-yl diphosphate synthase, partial [Micromonospora sp.]|nr:4-hydroxy-3-methylbut-2-en-1-yl diphosphate synthase [Micromonospora sp.]
IKTVPESQIVETLISEALRIADEMGADLPEELRDLVPGPSVTVH